MVSPAKSVKGRAFRLAVVTTLAVFCLYLVALIVAQAGYIDRDSVQAVLSATDVRHAVGLTLLTATVSTMLALGFAIPAAYALSRYRFPAWQAVDALIDLPVILSPVAIGVAILMLMRTPAGSFVDGHLVGFVFSVPGIVLAQFTIVTALAIRLLKSTFDDQEPRYEQVARFLGCSAPGAFFRVTLPMARGGIVSAALLCWARAMGEFGATVTVAGATRMRTATLPTLVYLSLETVDLARVATLISLMLVLAMAVLVALRLVGGGRSAG